jgi:RimJ/RimL family protein N-acetyltransferase
VLPELPADVEMRIATSRLNVVPLTGDDAIELFPVLDDPALGHWTGEAPPADADALRTRFMSWESRRSSDGGELWLNWTVRRRDDDRSIGHLQATVGDGRTAIAWVVGTDFQRQGFATEAARALIEWLLVDLGAPTIMASIHPGNVASQIVAHRAGLRPTDSRDGPEVVWEYVPAERRDAPSTLHA